MEFTRLSIIIPVFNEEKTITKVLVRVLNAKIDSSISKEIIIVNDSSTDHTHQVIEDYLSSNSGNVEIKYFKHDVNKGKGAALKTGIAHATGEYILIQDADLEYDPDEYSLLLTPILKGYADVVYGSRFVGGKPHRILFFWHSFINKFLTFLSNMFTNLNLTDMEICYKVFNAKMIKSITLKENRFGFEPEVTAKMSRIPDVRIYEVGVSYYGRTYKEGKKINWKDGVRALYCIIRYNLIS